MERWSKLQERERAPVWGVSNEDGAGEVALGASTAMQCSAADMVFCYEEFPSDSRMWWRVQVGSDDS